MKTRYKFIRISGDGSKTINITEALNIRQSVRMTREFLTAITNRCDTPRIPKHIRDLAEACLRFYPTDHEIERTGPVDIWGTVCKKCGSDLVKCGKRVQSCMDCGQRFETERDSVIVPDCQYFTTVRASHVHKNGGMLREAHLHQLKNLVGRSVIVIIKRAN
jgi:hypothetical protein